jgi:photosystem II stability/assembly factor-like uncharacterized protein
MKKNIYFLLLLLLNTGLTTLAQPSSWFPRGAGGGGALFSPSINPGNANEYYVACDMTDMFHTTDFGQSYSQLPFRQFESGQLSKMCFTKTAGLLYCINNNFVSGIAYPAKSTDNGLTWKTLPGPDTTQNSYTLDVDYANPNRMVVSNYGQIYFSSDGGVTFTSIHTATVSADGNTVGGVFFDGNNIYIGTNDGVLVSINAGINWSIPVISGIASGEKIFSFAAARTGAVTRFYCLTTGTGNWNPGSALSSATGGGYAGFTLGVYTCQYGNNWVASTSGIALGTNYPMFLAMAQNDVSTAYITGGSSAGNPVVLKTINSGTSWNAVFNCTNNQNVRTGWIGQGGDHGWSFPEVGFGIAVAANSSNAVIFTDFSDVHQTTDGGSNWRQAYVNSADEHPAGAATPINQNYHSIGLENTSCWQVLWSDVNTIFSGYSDIRGIRSADAGLSWSFNYTGNTANSTYRIAKAANGTLFAATSNIHDMYQSTHITDARCDAADANGKIIYSADKGLTWSLVHSFGHPVFWIALDPNNPNRAYASVVNHAGSGAAGGVYRCDNLASLGAATWTLLTAPPRTEGHPASLTVLNDGKLVASFSARNSSGFSASSGCFLYDPVAGTWSDVSDPGMHYWTKDMTIDPNDAQQNTWYAGVFCGWGGAPNTLGGLYKTTNRGASWTRITSLNSMHNVTSCTFNPNKAGEIYVTTEYEGLWICSNVNAGSPVFTPVNNYPFKQPERVFFNPFNTNEIWVSSFGNGMKMGTLQPSGVAEFSAALKLEIYPNPASAFCTVIVPSGNAGKELFLFDSFGRIVRAVKVSEGLNQIDLNGLAAGVYVARYGSGFARLVISN